MANWFRNLPRDATQVTIERYTVGGSPSAVVAAVFVIHRDGGRTLRVPVPIHPPMTYETLADDLRALNRYIAVRRRAGR